MVDFEISTLQAKFDARKFDTDDEFFQKFVSLNLPQQQNTEDILVCALKWFSFKKNMMNDDWIILNPKNNLPNQSDVKKVTEMLSYMPSIIEAVTTCYYETGYLVKIERLNDTFSDLFDKVGISMCTINDQRRFMETLNAKFAFLNIRQLMSMVSNTAVDGPVNIAFLFYREYPSF